MGLGVPEKLITIKKTGLKTIIIDIVSDRYISDSLEMDWFYPRPNFLHSELKI